MTVENTIGKDTDIVVRFLPTRVGAAPLQQAG